MNMIKYIDHYGMYSFEEYPFNDVDNTILCQVSYVLFENIIEEDTPYTIGELSSLYFSKYKEEDIKKDKSLIAKAPLVLKEMANSYRYKDIIMHDFINISSDEKSYQFAAMQFDLSDDTTYISFRGTDDQILGWKEDFDMAYKKVPGYMYAKKYINRYCSLFKKYRVGGHSKGDKYYDPSKPEGELVYRKSDKYKRTYTDKTTGETIIRTKKQKSPSSGFI